MYLLYHILICKGLQSKLLLMERFILNVNAGTEIKWSATCNGQQDNQSLQRLQWYLAMAKLLGENEKVKKAISQYD